MANLKIFCNVLGIQSWWVASASRPTITMGETEIPFLKMHPLNLKPIKKWLNLLNQILCINGGHDVNMK